MAEAPLQNLGRYKLGRVLGKGAMGIVYEALDPRLNRKIAIKTILVGSLDEATARDYSKRFAREAQAVARLNHPNIVQVYDYGEEGDIAYIVMEFVRGKELKSSFDANERFDIKTTVRLMCELLDALNFAHDAGVIHRDIKPANVMIDSDGHAKLADFGVARISDPDRQSTGATQVGTMVGTPAYMSPEQIQGLKIDRRTDIFSAGVILYQFLTGKKPFSGGAWTMAKMILQEDPQTPSTIAPVSPDYDQIVFRALAKNPDNRYQSADEFGRALQDVLKGKKLAPPPPPVPEPGPALANAAAAGTEVELEFWGAIKDTDDPEELELYLENFPAGVYTALAKRRLEDLRRGSGDQTAGPNERNAALEKARRETEARVRKEAEERQKKAAAERKARAEAEAAARREAEEKARREAERRAREEAAEKEKARRAAVAQAKREAEERAMRAAEEKARREAEERARIEAEARARREAEEQARREAEERARIEAEARARREAEEKIRREAEEKLRREAEERARIEAEARAKREAEERARREAEREARSEKREAERARSEAGEAKPDARRGKGPSGGRGEGASGGGRKGPPRSGRKSPSRSGRKGPP